MRTFALVQAIVNKDEASKALDSYRDMQMPYLPRVKKVDRQKHIERLMAEVSKGPLKITHVMQKQAKSKLRSRVIQRSQAEQEAADKRVSGKIGGFV